MASLPPLGGSPPPVPPRTRRARGRDEDPSYAAAQAQRDASKQIEAAAQSVTDARHDADVQIDQIHDYYDARQEEEYARDEAALEKQRLKGYERLQALKREQEAEFSRTRKGGERDLEKLNNYYRDTTYATERAGDQKLHEIDQQQARSLEYARKTKEQDAAMARDLYTRQNEETRAQNEARLAELKETNDKDYERMRSSSVAARERAQKAFEDKYQTQVKQADETLVDLENRASESLREIRRDTSTALAAYSDRQSDPFYQMRDLNARLEDDGDSYVLTATIPLHEQKHISVAVKGGQLVLSGTRHNEEKLELEPGRLQGTNSFQSFLETFPITSAVDANKMTRSFDGEELTVRVPKKAEYTYHSMAEQKIPVQRARLERPQFPDNLPHVSQDPYAENPDTGRPAGKRKGSGTLS